MLCVSRDETYCYKRQEPPGAGDVYDDLASAAGGTAGSDWNPYLDALETISEDSLRALMASA